MEFLTYIGLIVIVGLLAYLIAKSVIGAAERRRFRKKNREHQYSGSATKEERGFFTSIFNVTYSSQAESLGESGELRVASYLADLPCEDYWVFNDMLILDGKYSTQIDHIVISRYGVFVLETKNIHGKVYGRDSGEFWTQYLPDFGYRRFGSTQEHKLRNPIWQNAGHIKALRRLVFGYDVPVHGMVVFPQETDLRVNTEQPILQTWDIVPYIKEFREEILSPEQMDYYRQRLMACISTSESDRKLHLENVYRNQEKRDTAVASGRCPLCGCQLVLRNGKYGHFWGCSNYPTCKYTLQN